MHVTKNGPEWEINSFFETTLHIKGWKHTFLFTTIIYLYLTKNKLKICVDFFESIICVNRKSITNYISFLRIITMFWKSYFISNIKNKSGIICCLRKQIRSTYWEVTKEVVITTALNLQYTLVLCKSIRVCVCMYVSRPPH